MKKLLTLIGAAAMAFGLFADPLLTGIGFDTHTAETSLDTSGGYWSEWTAGEGEALTVKAWEGSGESYTGERPTLVDDGGAVNFLNVKTAFTNPLLRNINADGATQAIATGLYFDQLVKFTARDDESADVCQGEKLAIYTKEILNDKDEVADIRLYVRAGKYSGSELGSAVYDCGSIQDGWHRVTIKAIDGVYNTVNAGFVLYIDGASLAYVEGETGYDTSRLLPVGKALNAEKRLFPCLVGDVNVLVGVGFAGQGMIDDLALTDQAPAFAQDKYFIINWDEHVAELSYTVDDKTTVVEVTEGEAGFVGLPCTGAMDVEVAVTYSENYGKGEWTASEGVTVDGTTFKVTDGNHQGYVVSEDVTPRLAVTIGGNTEAYPSFAKALAVINAQAAGATIKLNEDIALGTIEEGSDAWTEAQITSQGAVTIDLNGKTITGPANCAGYAIESTSALTIIDSCEVGGGLVSPADGNAGAVYVLENALTITDGTFDGAVDVDDGSSMVSGGAFLKGSEATFPLTLAEGCVVNEVSGYWMVTEPLSPQNVTFTAPECTTVVKVEQSGEEIKVDEDGRYAVMPGEAVVTLQAAPGYFFAGADNPTEAVETVTIIKDVTEYALQTSSPSVIVALINGTPYASFADAAAEAKHGDTIRIVADSIETKAAKITGSAEWPEGVITIENNSEVVWNGDAADGTYAILINGASVLFTGTGTWAKKAGTASLVQAGATAEANVVVEGGNFVAGEDGVDSNKVPSNLIASKNGTIQVNGGTFVNYRGDEGRCIRAEGTMNADKVSVDAFATAIIYGGEFTVCCTNVSQKAAIASKHIAVDNKGQTSGSVQINGGKFMMPDVNVQEIVNANGWCGAGFKLKFNEQSGWYERTAIEYATLTLTSDEGVKSLVATNAAGLEFHADAKFDKDLAVTLYAKYELNETGVELDAEKSVLEVTMDDDREIKVFTKPVTPVSAWPTEWGDADDSVKAKLAGWMNKYGVTDLDGKKDQFLLDLAPDAPIPELKIENIFVGDALVTIVVSMEGVDLEKINGVLNVYTSEDLTIWTQKEIWPMDFSASFVEGKATLVFGSGPSFFKAEVGAKPLYRPGGYGEHEPYEDD